MSVVALELKTISGIPLHPLIVHIPVVLIPLAFIVAILALVRPSWRHWALPATAILALVSGIGVQLAESSGEGLESLGEHSALIERHSQLAEQTGPLVLIFFLLAAGAAVAHYLANREDAATSPRTQTLTKMLVPLCALSVLMGAVSSVWVYRTGHSGAESVWKGEGGEKKDGGTKDKEGGEKSGDESPKPDGDTDGD